MSQCKQRVLGILVIGLIVLLLTPILYIDHFAAQHAHWTNGILDVSRLDFSEGLYQLSGEVMVYPNQLISPTSGGGQGDYKQLPFSWKTRGDQVITHGSYEFLLDHIIPGDMYGFYFLDALTAYEVFADGVSIAKQGVPRANPSDTVAASKVQVAYFRAQDTHAKIVIHVATKDSHIVGMWQKTLFGPMDQVFHYALKARQADAFMIGAIFMMAVYFWLVFLIMRQDRAILYFSLVCTTVLVKAMYSGQQLGFENYPFIGYGVGLRLAYAMVPLVVVTVIAFIDKVFTNIFPVLFKRVCQWLSAIQVVLILVTGQAFYQETFVFFQGFSAVAALLILFWLIKAVYKGREGALVYLSGYVVFLVTALNDILYSMLLIQTGYYLSFGLFILILSQAGVLAMRIQRAFDTETYLKNHLENLVDERTQELEDEKNKFEALSKVDSLTRLYNKGYLLDMLQYELEGYNRYHGNLSVLMIDLDHFKVINDTYGHLVGDEVLTQVASTLVARSRRTDIVGRFGGEEFMMVLRFTALEDAIRHAEQLRLAIENLEFKAADVKFTITASFGVATAYQGIVDEKDLIHDADAGLYMAKRMGRNQVGSVQH